MVALLLLLAGCEIAPSHVTSADVDDALARKNYKTMCVGLKMKDDDVRRYTTERLLALADFDPVDPAGVQAGKDCICAAVKDPQGRIDLAIAEGLKGSKRDEVVSCLAEALKDPAVERRQEGVVALSRTASKAARDTLAQWAKSDPDPEVRKRAIATIAGDVAYKDVLLGLATGPDEAELRAAAVEGLVRMKDPDVLTALGRLAQEDKAGAVRGAALGALKVANAEGIDKMLCDAMMKDESADVRRSAVLAFRGTKRDEAVACLRQRALSKEDDASVREALLTTLKSSPNQKAADVLCEAIPFWMKSYVIDDLPDKIPGTDIAKAQNDRDWDNSYKCMERAYRSSGGYSCYARMYTAWWFEQVGGSAHIPKCPKYED